MNTGVVTLADAEIDNDPYFNVLDDDVYDIEHIFFYHNVIEGIEMDMYFVLQDEEAPQSNSSSYASSKELNFLNDSDSNLKDNRDKSKFPKYNVENEKRNPNIEIRFIFGSFEELKYFVRNYAVFNRVSASKMQG